MANIKCKSCGRRYSYHESDLCPNCGAYNRPSSRLRVDFDKDGNAELLTETAFLQQSKAGKQREKVCYERKECHEAQVRRPASKRAIRSDEGGSTQLRKSVEERGEQLLKSLYTDKKGESRDGAKVLTGIGIFLLWLILRACSV